MKKSRISIKVDGKLIQVDQIDILYVVKKQHASEIYLKNKKYKTLDIPLIDIEKSLDNIYFFRIHSSFLINLNEIDMLVEKEGRWFVIMTNQMKFRVASSKLKLFKERFIIL